MRQNSLILAFFFHVLDAGGPNDTLLLYILVNTNLPDVQKIKFLLHGQQTLDILFVCFVNFTKIGKVPLALSLTSW